jgi:hypothetical protein
VVHFNELIDYLSLIPTGDNSQMFRYRIQDEKLIVLHLKELSKHTFNQSQIASLLSFGSIIHVIKLFCDKYNLEANFHFAKDFSNENTWLTCTFKGNIENALPLKENNLKYLHDRYTDRGIYQKNSSLNQYLESQYKSSQISFSKNISSAIKQKIYFFECMMFDDLKVFKDIEKWFRYSKNEVDESKTGMSLKNVGLDPVNGLIFKLFKKNTFLNFFLRPYLKFLIFLKVYGIYFFSSGFAVCYMEKDDDQSVIQMGEKIMELWLDLTKHGHTLQPITAPVLLPFLYKKRRGLFLKKYSDQFEETSRLFKQEFHISGEPIWMFRFGPATKALKNNRSLKQDSKNLIV